MYFSICNRRGKKRVTRMIVAVVLGITGDNILHTIKLLSFNFVSLNSICYKLVANPNHSRDEINKSVLFIELFRHASSYFTCARLQFFVYKSSSILLLVRELQKGFPQSEFIKLKCYWCLCGYENMSGDIESTLDPIRELETSATLLTK